MRLCARAFADYEYVHVLCGDDPVERLAGTTREFGSQAWDARDVVVGALLADGLVGLAAIEPLGACRVCTGPPPSPPVGEDPFDRGTFRFETLRREAHASLVPHAHLKNVAVEPVVQGAGLGRAVTRAVLDAYLAEGPGPVLLECVARLEAFYQRFGFAVVARFPDPVADDLILMLLEA